jgi:hypothetical protein
MKSTKTRTAIRLAAAGACLVGTLACPAVASAAGPAMITNGAGLHQDWGPRGPWYHPEWGPGWNNGYPAPGWVPPAGWAPPPGWAPPVGWYPPAGYAPPQNWVGPCAGPLFDLFHPVRCA